MIDGIIEFFSFAFLVRAFIVGSLVSLCSSLLGVTLVLKRYSMIGDGLAHVAFGTLSVAVAFNMAPLQVSIPVVMIAAFFLLRISQNSKIQGDAAIAIISTSALAIGIIATSATRGLNIDVSSFMFGSILAMTIGDVYISVILSIVVIGLYSFLYHKIFAVTFDENFMKATGTPVGIYNMLTAFLTAITIVIGMRIMGAMLISSLIIFPALTSMRVFKTFRSVVVSSAFVSIICFYIGLAISFGLSLPTGASVVVVNLGMFILFSLVGILFKR